MAVFFISYAEEYFEKVLGEKVPGQWDGKFVQVRNNGDEYLLFSPKGFAPYHADIVKKFSEDQGLAGKFFKPKMRFDIEEPGWMVTGGGKYRIDRGEKTLLLYDNSMAYGCFEAAGMKEKILSVHELSGYMVRIE